MAREAESFIYRQAQQGKPFFLYVPFLAPHMPLEAKITDLERFSHLPPGRRVYAAMIWSMDEAVGRIVSALRQYNLQDNTIIVFLSDNGGPVGVKSGSNFSSNAPLRAKKATLYEGGIRVPFFIHWPARIAPSVVEVPVIQLDVAPTVLSAVGAEPSSQLPVDGKDLLPLLDGRAAGPVHEYLYWRVKGQHHAIRDARFKLIRTGTNPPELYDLAADIGETRNLAAELPETVDRLQAAFTAWDMTLVDPAWPAPAEVARHAQQSAVQKPE